mgnify:CR=1 FL=1
MIDSSDKDWWKGNHTKVPAWAFVLRALLTNSPNSIPQERVFSILNDTFDDDQKNGRADYSTSVETFPGNQWDFPLFLLYLAAGLALFGSGRV